MKKTNMIILAIISVFLLASYGCAQTLVTESAQDTAAQTGNEDVDNVAENIDSVGTTEEELDDSELEDVEETLADLENI